MRVALVAMSVAVSSCVLPTEEIALSFPEVGDTYYGDNTVVGDRRVDGIPKRYEWITPPPCETWAIGSKWSGNWFSSRASVRWVAKNCHADAPGVVVVTLGR